MAFVGEVDAIRFNRDLVDTYKRYLFTSNMISDGEQDLQKAFLSKLGQEFEIVRGPYVHATPCYRPSLSVRDLVDGKGDFVLSKGMLDLPTDVFDPDRPLYSHQVEGMSRLGKGRNLVVATGTGSGKTESYLLPILDSILKDPSPGLRAIIIYPLNALANDQLFRLRELLREMPRVTFGRFTGETPEKPGQDDHLVNERASRSEIRESPPHILLTNFAMLEYLLLRPTDSEIFTGNKLKFIILDEAHTYSGAQGIEIAMLMRRLKYHLGDHERKIKFILTSATIGDGEKAKPDVAKFASDLTGNAFDPEDVLSGETVNSFSLDMKEEPPLKSVISKIAGSGFEDWQNALGDPLELSTMLGKVGFSTGKAQDWPVSKILYQAFCSYSPLAKIHDLCRQMPVKLEELAVELGLDQSEDSTSVVRWLVTLGAHARKSADYAPLLPTRLHYFCRGLAGATLCLNEDCKAKAEHPQSKWSDFFLDDRNTCPTCEKKVLPILSCVHCGLPVVRIYLEDGKWKKSLDPARSQKTILLTWAGDVGEGVDEDSEDDPLAKSMTLCLSCNQAAEGTQMPPCCEAPVHRTLQLIPTEKDQGELPRCTSCGGTSGSFPSVLREFSTSEDAPTAVLAEAIVRNLPFDVRRRDVTANGRKLLVFSDSRQRAAFFAPYLLQTTAETAFQGPIESAIRSAEDSRDGQPVSFRKVAQAYEDGLESMTTVVFKDKERGVTFYKLVPEVTATDDNKEEARYEAERVLYRHFCSSQKQKTTLAGMGIATLAITYTSQGKSILKERLPELFGPDEQRGWQVLHALLEVMVQRIAVDFPNHVKANPHVVPFGPISYTFHLKDCGRRDMNANNSRQLYRWNPYIGPERGRKRSISGSRQLEILCKALNLDRIVNEDALKSLLLKIWDAFIAGAVLNEVGVNCPGEYRVNRDRLAITSRADLFACRVCGKVTPLGQLGFCTKVGCKGVPQRLSEEEIERKFDTNHYRKRYKLPALPLEVREHTAQLSNELGKVYQEQFNQGKVNVLSSSTTFEMGIDVGDLKAVMLRNFPPSASSYIQRAGRAGRRQDGVSVALTFARNVPHDQYNFHEPTIAISGKVNAPIINTANVPLAQRHCNSMLLGSFLRGIGKLDGINLDRLSVQDFFVIKVAGQTLVETYKAWVLSSERRNKLEVALSNIIPVGSALLAEVALEASVNSLVTDEKSVWAYHVASEIKQFRDKIEELRQESMRLMGNNDLQAAHKLTAKAAIMQRLQNQFLEQRLIDFLSGCSWLPGYAFPQDIVKLKVLDPEYSQRMRLERDREVGISEYAPGAEIIADGKLFTSAGVEYKGQPDVRWWINCRECRRIETGRITDDPPTTCSNCGTSFLGASEPRPYIRPDGFTTSIEDPPAMPRLSRLRPPRTSEVFLLEGADYDSFVESKVSGITYGIKKGGKLFRANSGNKFKSFLLCPTCGRYFASRPQKPGHEKPWGPRCNGVPKPLDLAHEIVTDILQLRFQGCSPQPPNLIDGKSFWRSLFAAFINGATDCLDIAPGDIDGTYHGWSMESYIGEIVVYDRIPGGAGHIERIVQNIDAVLYSAYRRVKDCSCSDIDASCYACLRSYSNQFYWDDLQRRPVIEWLSKVLGIEE